MLPWIGIKCFDSRCFCDWIVVVEIVDNIPLDSSSSGSSDTDNGGWAGTD